MALRRVKATLPFQLAVQEETNPLKREVSSGQEALLTPSSGALSCPPPNSPKQSPRPWQREISKSSKAPPSINPLSQPISNQLLSPQPHQIPPTHTRRPAISTNPSTTKTKTQASNIRWVLLPPTPVPAHFLPGRVGGGRDPLLSGQAHPHSPGAAGRSLTHPENAAARGRSPRAGGGPLRAEGARVPEKPAAATGMPGPEPAPPSPRAPLVPGPSPAPWARP